LVVDAEESLGADDTQTNKRSLAHVGSTEQRIRFKEVQLKEKARPEPMPSERKSPDLLERVATIYTDVELDKTASQAPLSGALEQSSSNLKGVTGSAAPRKRKKGSRKGKERAVDVNEEDAMDTT
jgi:general transcription factor 3C polypeptide 6